MASPLSTLSRSSKFRLPSPTGTSSGTGTDHSSSSRHSSLHPSPREKKSDLNLDDDSDYDDEPAYQAPQLSALARMLLSESPKASSKPPSPPRQAPYTTRPRQKLSWGQASEYDKPAEDVSASSPKDEDPSPSYRGSRDFVTPAPRLRTIRPFTGPYYTTTKEPSGDADGDNEKQKDATMANTHAAPENAVRTQLGSAARWKRATSRGIMGGLAGAPRRGGIRRESSDQADEERAEETSQEPVGYELVRRQSGGSAGSPGGSPLQRASRAQLEEEEKQNNEPRQYALTFPRSRGNSPELKSNTPPPASSSTDSSQQPPQLSWSRRATPEARTPEARTPERQKSDGEDENPSPTPKESVRPAYARFTRRAPSASGYASRSNDPPATAPPAQQSTSGDRDKENMPPLVQRRVVTVPPKIMGSSSNPDPQDPPSPSKAPKMASLVPTPPQTSPESRNALATRDRNTPHRPAPPPPKMSIMDTATAAAGAVAAQSASVRSRRGNVVINGRQYRRLDAIGKGGSSKVYKVMAENFRVFAMKKVTFNDEEDGQAAILGYKGEIELLKQLSKVDRVIRLFDWEINDERGTLVMLMECGETDLAKLLQSHYAAENAALDISFTRHYWREMLLCVQAVHALNIIHSDLKPANFLVVQGRLKLIDFGIANAIVGDTVNVHRESQVGTVNYMSPEALTDVSHTPAGRTMQGIGPQRLMKLGAPSDVWSLGCILYQMCYGRTPFHHLSSIYKKLAAIPNPNHEIEYPDTGIGAAAVPKSVIWTIQDCLQRDKDDRATIAQLLSDDNLFLHPDKRREGMVEVSEETLRRMLENVVEYTSKGQVPDKETVRAWAKSIYGKLEIQGRRRPQQASRAGGS